MKLAWTFAAAILIFASKLIEAKSIPQLKVNEPHRRNLLNEARGLETAYYKADLVCNKLVHYIFSCTFLIGSSQKSTRGPRTTLN